jgi:MarR family transcriptional regulator for hemolysin
VTKHLDRTEGLARAIGRLRRNMRARAAKVLEREGAPLVHWQLISAIAREGLHSQIALADRVGMDPAGTSRALDQLEKMGLVKRERDGGDRRRVRVDLTLKGRRWFDRIRVVVMTALAPVFDGLSASDVTQLEELLSRIEAHSSASGSFSPGS